MLRLLLCVAALIGGTTIASAQTATSALRSLETRQDSQGWEAVGRLDIDNKGFCTAVLIQDRLLLTAAHCVYGADRSLIPADRFVFQAGLKNGRAEAVRNIRRLVAHPAYLPGGPSGGISDVANDIAVLELDQPIRRSGIEPFPIADRPQRGDNVAIVSYGRDRAEAASLQETCSILGRQNGALVMDCEAEFGSSGAPVFRVQNGRAQIVSVISAIAQSGGDAVSLGTSLQVTLEELLAHFAAEDPAQTGSDRRLITMGQRNATGAKFIRP